MRTVLFHSDNQILVFDKNKEDSSCYGLFFNGDLLAVDLNFENLKKRGIFEMGYTQQLMKEIEGESKPSTENVFIISNLKMI